MSESDNSDYDPIPDNEEIEENDTPPDGGEAAVLADIWGAPGAGKDDQQEDEGTEEQTEGRNLFSPTNGATSALELMRVKSTEQANPEKDDEDDDDEQNTPEEVEKENAEDTGEPPAKRAARQGLTRLPLSRIKTMLKNFDPDWKGQSADAAVALILAGEQFIENLARRSYQIAETGRRKTVKKDDVKFVFQTEEEYAFLDGCFDSKTGCL